MARFTLIAMAVALVLLFGCASSPINEGVTKDGRAYRGADSPKVVIMEYSDFQCPFCSAVLPTVDQVLHAYPDAVQLQYRNSPLPSHPRAFPSAVAAVCAEEQGKFWQMHDRLFSNQGALEDADLQGYAKDIGLDTGKFSSCYSSSETAAKVKKDMAEGAAAGVAGTPTFIIGQSVVRGAQDFSAFKQAIDLEIARAS